MGQGHAISAMGIGDEWNDTFLDALASTTGGSSSFINSPSAVVRFLNDRVRSLGAAFAERLQLSVAPDADVTLESVFKLMPNPQPVDIHPQPIPIGALEFNRPLAVLIQLQMPPSSKAGFRTFVRLDITGDVLAADRQRYKVLSDISIEIAENPVPEEPPLAILDALGKLTLYRMQQRRRLAKGGCGEATWRLENWQRGSGGRRRSRADGDGGSTARLQDQRAVGRGAKSTQVRTRMLLRYLSRGGSLMKTCPYCAHSIAKVNCSVWNADNSSHQQGVATTQLTGDDRAVHERRMAWGTPGSIRQSTIRFTSRITEPINLASKDELMLGRSDLQTGWAPDLDMSPFGGAEMGVSRRHASIRRGENTLMLVDLGSANGTHLNGQRLTPDQPRVLRDGDEVRMGKRVFRNYFKTVST